MTGLGAWGETEAERFVTKNGYRLLSKNFRSRYGEIDLIAREEEILCFVEVKTRSKSAGVSGTEAMGSLKQQKLIGLAKGYCQLHGLKNVPIRFDLLLVTPQAAGKTTKIQLIKGVFEMAERTFR